MSNSRRTTRTKSTKKWYVILIVLVLAAGVMTTLEATNTTHLFHKSAVVRAPSKPIAKLPAQPAANNGNKVSSSTPALEQGTDTDENGQVPSGGVSTDPSTWSTSTSGVITVKSPTSNATIQSGATITGTASVSQVQYTLIDNQVGVISQGPINVVGGNFTAAMNFATHSTSGRLDVYSTEPDGREINEVQIPVNF